MISTHNLVYFNTIRIVYHFKFKVERVDYIHIKTAKASIK